jgi:hypothetical protein
LRAEPAGVGDVGIEVLANPLFELSMALVTRMTEGFEELGITPGAADIFGGTSSGSFDQDRRCPAEDRSSARS